MHTDGDADRGAATSGQAPGAARRSGLLLAVAALLFSLMVLCAKQAAGHLPGAEIACLRFLFGLAVGGTHLALGHKLQLRSHRALLLRGVFGGGAVLLYFGAIAHLPVGIATLLNSSWPLFVALFSTMFLAEPLGVRTVLALLTTLSGVTLVVLGNAPLGTAGGRDSLLWGLCGVASAVLSGAAVTTIRAMRQREGSWEIFLTFCLVGGLITGVPTALNWVTPSTRDAFYLLLMGVASVVAQLMMTHALRDVRAVAAGLILQITPVATFLLGVLLLGERPLLLGYLGAAVTVAGVTWGMLARSK